MGITGREAVRRFDPDEAAAKGATPSAQLASGTTASLGLWPWVQLATSDGIAVEHVCELAGIEVGALRDPETRFDQVTANGLAELSYARFGPGAAMKAALTVEPGHFNLLELLGRSAPNVRAAIEQVTRHFALLHDAGQMVAHNEPGGGLTLLYRPGTAVDTHFGYSELSFAVTMISIRRETGCSDILPSEVCFRHACPGDLTAHRSLLGAHLRFDAAVDMLRLSKSTADLPLSRDNPFVHAQAEQTARALLDE